MVRQTVRLFWCLNVLRIVAASFFVPIYSLYLVSKGFNLLEINIINTAFWVTNLVMEVPTGALADVIGRRKCYIFSCCLSALAILLYGRVHSLADCLVCEVLASCGNALANGTSLAWMTQRLNQHGQAVVMKSVIRQSYTLGCVGGIVASVSGARLYEIHPFLPWLAGGITLLFGAAVSSIAMKEDYPRQVASFADNVTAILGKMRHGIHYAWQHLDIRIVLVFIFLEAIAVQAPNMEWQLYFRRYLPRESWLGFLFGGISLSLGAGSLIGSWVEKKDWDEKRALFTSLLVTGTGLALVTLIPTAMGKVSMFLFHEVSRGFFRPLKDGYINHHIKDEDTRATVLSVASLPTHIGSVLGLMIMGYVAQRTSIPAAWILSGGGLVVITLLLAARKSPAT